MVTSALYITNKGTWKNWGYFQLLQGRLGKKEIWFRFLHHLEERHREMYPLPPGINALTKEQKIWSGRSLCTLLKQRSHLRKISRPGLPTVIWNEPGAHQNLSSTWDLWRSVSLWRGERGRPAPVLEFFEVLEHLVDSSHTLRPFGRDESPYPTSAHRRKKHSSASRNTIRFSQD